MSQFELQTRHALSSPGGTLALAMHRCAAYATAVGLFVLLGTTWLEQTVALNGADIRIRQWSGIELFNHDRHAVSSIALVLYLCALVGAVVRPAQRSTSILAAIVGLAATLLLFLATSRHRIIEEVPYLDDWLPTPFLAITLWVVSDRDHGERAAGQPELTQRDAPGGQVVSKPLHKARSAGRRAQPASVVRAFTRES